MVEVLERVLVSMTDQTVEEEQGESGSGPPLPQTQGQPDQDRPTPLSNPPSSGIFETPEDRARRERKERIARAQERKPFSTEEQKRLGRYLPPGYPVIIGQRVATKGGLKRR